jgi:hypothetical protein
MGLRPHGSKPLSDRPPQRNARNASANAARNVHRTAPGGAAYKGSAVRQRRSTAMSMAPEAIA